MTRRLVFTLWRFPPYINICLEPALQLQQLDCTCLQRLSYLLSTRVAGIQSSLHPLVAKQSSRRENTALRDKRVSQCPGGVGRFRQRSSLAHTHSPDEWESCNAQSSTGLHHRLLNFPLGKKMALTINTVCKECGPSSTCARRSGIDFNEKAIRLTTRSVRDGEV
ncbi:unnamed protein product [Periconia digitata]|uniref:Uncharacterized protein n=1 Tax=Periconia digitata TaxID=1303443 RepID=A0A9W4UMP9_9PLEO|nr:unnamed protein product [Periconia digitata]